MLRRLAFLLLGVAGLGAAWADPPARVGRVNWTEGEVTLQQAANAEPGNDGESESVDSPRNWPVTSGDSLTTGENARTEVSIGSTLIRLDENTRLEIARLDDEAILLRLIEGSLALVVRNDEQARGLDVQAGVGSVTPTGAGLYRVDADDDTVSATAWRNALRVSGPAISLTVAPGQRAEFAADGGWHRIDTPEIDRFASWAMNQDERYGEVTDVSPEMTGAEDLAEHGDWSTHPEYGRVWAPRVVPVGWVPYRHGRWAWVRPWGWTWIDAAPWGFAPFHYGRWVHWGPRWVWVPGTWVARPTYAPAVVGWIGSPGFSVSVTVGPSVGWFPLAPFEVYAPYYDCTPRYVRHVNYAHVPRIERAELYVGGRTRVISPPHRYRYRDDRRVFTTLPGNAFLPRRPVIVSPGTSPLRPPREVQPRPSPGLPIAATPGGPPVARQPLPRPDLRQRPGERDDDDRRGRGDGGGWRQRPPVSQPGIVAPAAPAARPDVQAAPVRRMPMPIAGNPPQVVAPVAPPPRPVQRETRGVVTSPAIVRPGWTTAPSPPAQAQPVVPAAARLRAERSPQIEPRAAPQRGGEARQQAQPGQLRRNGPPNQ